MFCRTMNTGGSLCVYGQVLEIKPLLLGFALQPVQQPGHLRMFGQNLPGDGCTAVSPLMCSGVPTDVLQRAGVM